MSFGDNMKIFIIYMAAGNSERFGSNKLLHKISGTEMYKYGLKSIVEAVKHIKAMAGNDISDISQSEPGFIYPAELSVKIAAITQYKEIFDGIGRDYETDTVFPIMNEESKKGVSFTIKCGITYAMEYGISKDDYIMFVTADQPYLTPDTILRVIKAGIMDAEASDSFLRKDIFVAAYDEVTGNPCMFRYRVIPELLKLKKDQGGRKVFPKFEVQRVQVASLKELWDIDEREEE